MNWFLNTSNNEPDKKSQVLFITKDGSIHCGEYEDLFFFEYPKLNSFNSLDIILWMYIKDVLYQPERLSEKTPQGDATV